MWFVFCDSLTIDPDIKSFGISKPAAGVGCVVFRVWYFNDKTLKITPSGVDIRGKISVYFLRFRWSKVDRIISSSVLFSKTRSL